MKPLHDSYFTRMNNKYSLSLAGHLMAVTIVFVGVFFHYCVFDFITTL